MVASKCISKSFELCIIKGVEGLCISLNDYRIAGNKPWGGGKIVKKWQVKLETITEALGIK